jgi:surfeit locus 1 family protein
MKMSAHFQRETNGSVHMAPFFLEADTQIGSPLAPKPDLKALTLSNRHLEYALTWWALAATLAAVFAVYVISRFRSGTG